MISVCSVLFSLVLFSELSSHLATVAMPPTEVENGFTEQEALDSILGDELLTEPAVVPVVNRRSLVLDNNVRDQDGSPKIIVISDMRLKGHRVRGLNPAFTQSFPLLKDRSLSDTPTEYLKIDRRDNDPEMLRCMIGRVYRPCWKA